MRGRRDAAGLAQWTEDIFEWVGANNAILFDNKDGLTIMVTKVFSQYSSAAPKEQLKAGEDRIITTGPLYPNMINIIDSCNVHSATSRANDFIALHKVDLGDLRIWVSRALQSGRYLNSQWCLGNSPKGLFACDSYVVSGDLYNPKTGLCELTEVYVKVCITKTGSTIAALSFHPSY